MTRFRIESDRQTSQVPNRASPMPTTTGRRFFLEWRAGRGGRGWRRRRMDVSCCLPWAVALAVSVVDSMSVRS